MIGWLDLDSGSGMASLPTRSLPHGDRAPLAAASARSAAVPSSSADPTQRTPLAPLARPPMPLPPLPPPPPASLPQVLHSSKRVRFALTASGAPDVTYLSSPKSTSKSSRFDVSTDPPTTHGCDRIEDEAPGSWTTIRRRRQRAACAEPDRATWCQHQYTRGSRSACWGNGPSQQEAQQALRRPRVVHMSQPKGL